MKNLGQQHIDDFYPIVKCLSSIFLFMIFITVKKLFLLRLEMVFSMVGPGRRSLSGWSALFKRREGVGETKYVMVNKWFLLRLERVFAMGVFRFFSMI